MAETGYSGNYPGEAITFLVRGTTTLDRSLVAYGVNLVGGVTSTDGVVSFTGFTVSQLIAASSVTTYCSAAGTGQTDAYIGIYQLDDTGNATLLGQTASTAAIITGTGQHNTPLTTPPIRLSPGTPYALGILTVGGSVNGKLYGVLGDATILSGSKKPFGATKTTATGLTTLPASVLLSAMSSTTGLFYAEITW